MEILECRTTEKWLHNDLRKKVKREKIRGTRCCICLGLSCACVCPRIGTYTHRPSNQGLVSSYIRCCFFAFDLIMQSQDNCSDTLHNVVVHAVSTSYSKNAFGGLSLNNRHMSERLNFVPA